MTYLRESVAAVSRLSVAPVTLQMDMFMLPSPVKERGRKGYFPFVLLLVDKETGMVTGMEMLTPEPDLQTMHESVPQKVLEKFGELGFRPERTEVRPGLLHGLVEGAL